MGTTVTWRSLPVVVLLLRLTALIVVAHAVTETALDRGGRALGSPSPMTTTTTVVASTVSGGTLLRTVPTGTALTGVSWR